jgi:hypothetical protein
VLEGSSCEGRRVCLRRIIVREGAVAWEGGGACLT